MRSTDRHPVADDLAQHAGFLRAVARGLVGDEHLAEDVVQQAYLQALARPPESRGFLRAWLARVVRNLALNRARGEARRSERERAAARPELDSAGERAALELTLQREVAAALAELDEPYRTVVHLRHFRGLAPAAIAAELGVPLKTVETRLTRAHARLRTRLARAWNEQDERARALWLASLPGAGKVLGGVLMTKQLVLVGVGGALLVGLVLTWRALQAPAEREEAPVVSAAALEVPLDPSVESREPTGARETVATEGSDAEEVSEPILEPDAELAAMLERLGPLLDRTLEGRMDPGAILDAALLIAAHDIGTPAAELDYSGALTIPLVGLPEGVAAELWVGSPLQKFIGLRVALERKAPLRFEGMEREGGSVHLFSSVDDIGELTSFQIGTDVAPTEAETDRVQGSGGSFRVTEHLDLITKLASPHDWKLTSSGERGEPIEDAYRRTIVHDELPSGLEGGLWPRIDDMRRLTRRLQELQELAKSRSAR